MATRDTRLIIKNSIIPSQALPSSGVLLGEGLVSLGDGILHFSGSTSGAPTWVPSDNDASYFEVGSNLYDLKIRNQITSYSGLTNLSGQFLSGTTNGFVLASIADISGVDSYVTGATFSSGTNFYNDGSITLRFNEVAPNVVISNITDNYTTGVTFDGSLAHFERNDGNLSAYTLDLSTFVSTADTFATGYTYTPSTNTFDIVGNNSFDPLSAAISSMSGLTLTNLTAGRVVYVGTGGILTDDAEFTYDGGTDLLSVGNVDVTTDLTVGGDAIIQGNLTVLGDSVSAFTTDLFVEDSNITLNYNPTGDTITTSINSGWMIQDGNGVAAGDVNLDIITMLSFTGLTAGNVPDILEYGNRLGYGNRGWITQLNDIVIRSTDVADEEGAGSITGVRVLAEFDILDGGGY